MGFPHLLTTYLRYTNHQRKGLFGLTISVQGHLVPLLLAYDGPVPNDRSIWKKVWLPHSKGGKGGEGREDEREEGREREREGRETGRRGEKRQKGRRQEKR